MKKSGIYIIKTITHPDRVYVGSAAILDRRLKQHRQHLRTQTHHSTLLQRHCDKYGIDDLQFEVLEEVPLTQLIEREQFYINELNPFFNSAKLAGSPIGIKRSEEFKARLRQQMRGNSYASGVKQSEEHIRKRVVATTATKIGKGRSEEFKAHMRIVMKGKQNAKGKRTEEQKQRMSLAHLNYHKNKKAA